MASELYFPDSFSKVLALERKPWEVIAPAADFRAAAESVWKQICYR